MVKFGMYAPVPHVTLNSKEITHSIHRANGPLNDKEVDPAFVLSRDVLTAADRCGFDIVLFAERHLGPDMEAWVLAAAIASLTRNIQIMPAVHPGLWYPAMIAKMGATLDRISPGRLAINMVTGWNEEEHRMFGGDLLLGTENRYERAEEFIEVLKGLWTSDSFTYNGKVYQMEDTKLLLKPASPSAPDIYTASRSELGLEMVAKTADWWFVSYDKNLQTSEEIYQSVVNSIEDMNRRAAKYNRRVKFAFNPFVVCEETDDKAEKRLRAIVEAGSDHDDGRLVSRRMLPALRAGFVGSPEKVADKMNQFHEAGIDMFLMKFPSAVEEVEKLGAEIISKFKPVPEGELA